MQIVSTRTVVGMEIHLELSTQSKNFTSAPCLAHPDRWDAPANTLVDPVTMALPGTLPVLNREAVELSMMVGIALGSDIPDFCKWDRKNYFYPDLPKGYQISQYDLPLCVGGSIEIETESGSRTIRIQRAHLEEDTGKLGHELPGGGKADGSLLDLNRAGTPLLEIVSEPDLQSAEEAVTFSRELHALCVFLGVTGGVMQKGHMRFEPNINVVMTFEDGSEVATPIAEVKNLNSFRAIKGAIEYESKRQVEQWKKDGVEMGPGRKATFGWDPEKMRTVLQRSKEDAHDYRYFPEPDLVPLRVDQAWRDQVRSRLPELPQARRQRYTGKYGLPEKDAKALVADPNFCFFYEDAIENASSEAAHATAKLLLNTAAKMANEKSITVPELGATPQQVAALVALRASGDIGSNAVERIFGLLCQEDTDAAEIAEREGLLQVRDEGAMDAWVAAAVEAHPQAAEDFASGKDAAVGRLMGEVMKQSGGQADASAVREKLIATLRS